MAWLAGVMGAEGRMIDDPNTVCPRIAVLMDENTSSGATRYEAHKGYFKGLLDAGGAPYGVPYAPQLVADVVERFDGLMAVGGRFAYPAEWYVDGVPAPSPPSPRFDVERSLMSAFLSARKPVLGVCAGMQMLACLNGGRLAGDLGAWRPTALAHDGPGLHTIHLTEGTLLRRLVGVDDLEVNTFHREAVADPGDVVRIGAVAEDGIIEAIELPGEAFALGVQWHQELFADAAHAGNAIFAGFVAACAGTRHG